MPLVIKDIETPGVVVGPGRASFDLVDWKNSDEMNFSFSLRLSIGFSNDPRADDFRIVICSRSHYDNSSLDEQKTVRRSKTLFLERYDLKLILKTLGDMVAECDSESWEESLQCLRKKFRWEYEYFNKVSPSDIH
jgi:Immunity protein 8